MTDTLKDELTVDPLARGYVGMTDQQATDDLNTAYRSRNRTSMTGREVRAEVVDTEYDVLTAEKKAQLLALTASEDLDPFGMAANVIKDIFSGSSVTISNLQTARVESITRAQELGIDPAKAGEVQVARA